VKTRQPRPDRLSPEHTALGRAVRITRAINGLSQEEVGHRGGLHRNYVGAIERGEINPTFRVLLKLERGLAIPLSELMERYEDALASPPPRSTAAGPPGPNSSTWRSSSDTAPWPSRRRAT